jgi:hypothetical protein
MPQESGFELGKRLACIPSDYIEMAAHPSQTLRMVSPPFYGLMALGAPSVRSIDEAWTNLQEQ